MENFKLTIELLPKGAWNNDLSKTLPKKDWDTIRNECYKKANYKCEICGYETTDLDAHEIWIFDKIKKTQTLIDIVALCTKCHGVKHFKNSVRLGNGEKAKEHFLKTNNCTELDFSNHLLESILKFEQLNNIYRWTQIANLKNFGIKDIKIKEQNFPMIENPYNDINFNLINFNEYKNLFKIVKTRENLMGVPKLTSIDVNNYQGEIIIKALNTDKIEWFIDNQKLATKYNTAGMFTTKYSVKEINGNVLHFKIINQNGEVISKSFKLIKTN